MCKKFGIWGVWISYSTDCDQFLLEDLYLSFGSSLDLKIPLGEAFLD